jgi:hypothetical protein
MGFQLHWFHMKIYDQKKEQTNVHDKRVPVTTAWRVLSF